MARGGLHSEGMAVMHFQEVPDGSVWSEDVYPGGGRTRAVVWAHGLCIARAVLV